MKLFKYGLPFAALALLASCANDNMGEPTPQPDPVEDGVYLAFNIAMPGVTRASEKEYDEGETFESAINDIKLYLYRSTDGGSNISFWKDVTPLGLGKYTPDTGTPANGVTGTQSVVFQLAGTDVSDAEIQNANVQYYALVVVNDPGFGTPSGVLSNFNQAFTETSMVRATLAKVTADVPKYTNKMIPVKDDKAYFTMTNAPLWDGSKVQDLVQLKKTEFKTSPEAAVTAAATVYVQRGVAKVTVTIPDDADGYGEKSSEAEGVKPVDAKGDALTTDDRIVLTGWALDITNKSAYPIQNVNATALAAGGEWDSTTKTWFIGKNALPGTTSLRQIEWAEDPNYTHSGSQLSDFLQINASTDIEWNEFGESNWEYCLENTMYYDAMKKDATTRVVFQGIYKLGGEAKSFVVSQYDRAAEISEDIVVTDLSTIPGTAKQNGKYKLSALVKEEKSSELTALAASLGLSSTDEYVYYYKNGVTYYTALIRHFDESEARLTGTSIENLNEYGVAQLGRYGVLRNNTYKIGVKNIHGYGSPEIPEPTPNEPDDKPDPINYNVTLDIKILDWVVRDSNGDITIK